MVRTWIAVLVFVLVGSRLSGQGTRDIGVEAARVGPLPVATERAHAGLFVGVNEFDEDPSLKRLDFAVDDAIAVAHLFVIELGLIKAERARLLLGGTAAGAKAKEQLEGLRKRGAVVDRATKPTILKRAREIARIGQSSEDLVLFFFGSHGFEGKKQAASLVPSDGTRVDIDETGVGFTTLEEILQGSRAGKKLLFWDACRSDPMTGVRERGADGPGERFHAAFEQAKGVAVVRACSRGQASHETTDFGHGVFTHFLLEALHGGVAGDTEGLIRAGAVHDHVAGKVAEWASRAGYVQVPAWSGEQGDARAIPLAIDPRVHGELAEFRARVEGLRPGLSVRSSSEGPFTIYHWAKLAEILKGVKPDRSGKSVVETCQLFLDKTMSEEAFASYVDGLKVSSPPVPSPVPPIPAPRPEPETPPTPVGKRVPAWAEKIADQPDPSIVTDPVALEALRTLDLAWRVRDRKTGIEMLLVPPGSYLRGSPDTEADRSADEGPQHRVIFTKPFYLGVYEVTQGEWNGVMGSNPSRFTGDDRLPVEVVSYDMIQQFLSKAGSNCLRLPSEAEWEYACRAGTTTPFSFGKTISTEQVNYDGNDTYDSGRKGAYRGKTVRVGSLPANRWGFHEMHGNVWEIVADTYGAKAYEACATGVTDPSPVVGDPRSVRVWRGGSWLDLPPLCRAALRLTHAPSFSISFGGFRVSRTP